MWSFKGSVDFVIWNANKWKNLKTSSSRTVVLAAVFWTYEMLRVCISEWECTLFLNIKLCDNEMSIVYLKFLLKKRWCRLLVFIA
jgi:hypothetical protein